MANEIQFDYQLLVTNGSFKYGGQPVQQRITHTLPGGGTPGKVTIATTPGTTVTPTGITTVGLCEISNLDTTNYVDVTLTMRVKAGEKYVVRLAPGATAPSGIANTAACVMNFNVLEN